MIVRPLMPSVYGGLSPVLSISNPLNFIERHLIATPVIEPSSPGGFMAGHVLSDLQLAAVLEVSGDPGGPEAVSADLGL